MNLGENIYRLRTGRNMSQGDLADALDVSRQSVSKWENNSAVPELEKLIRMSELSGVTLDQLVGRGAPTPPPQYETSAPVEKPTPPYRVTGVILLCFGLLTTMLMSFFAGFALGVMLGLPFTLVGSILIVSMEGHLFKCAWALFAIYAPLSFYFLLNFIGFGFLIRWAVLLVWFAALVIVSVRLYRRGKLSDDSKKLMFGSMIAAVALLILLGIANQAMYHHSGLRLIA